MGSLSTLVPNPQKFAVSPYPAHLNGNGPIVLAATLANLQLKDWMHMGHISTGITFQFNVSRDRQKQWRLE